MKKIQSQYTHLVYKAIIAAMTIVYVISLFIQIMTNYSYRAHNMANEHYVREAASDSTPWSRHYINTQVEYEQNITKV